MILLFGSERLSLLEVEAFLAASECVGFAGGSRAEIYRWREALLCHQEYGRLRRPAKGLIRAYMERMTGLSRAQGTRPIERYRRSGRIRINRGRCHTFEVACDVLEHGQLCAEASVRARIWSPLKITSIVQ